VLRKKLDRTLNEEKKIPRGYFLLLEKKKKEKSDRNHRGYKRRKTCGGLCTKSFGEVGLVC